MESKKRIEQIEELCEKNNLNIYEVFREAKIPTSTIFNWKKKEPFAFEVFDRLINTIEKLSVESTNA